MSERGTLAVHLHVDGFDTFHRDSFDRRKVRQAMRKVGRLVENRARMNLALAGTGSNYPQKRTGVLRDSVKTRVSRPGFLVKVMPERIAGMKDYYPAFLHYGVKRQSARKRGKKRSEAVASGGWRIAPRENYIADALQDESGRVQSVLAAGFAAALR